MRDVEQKKDQRSMARLLNNCMRYLLFACQYVIVLDTFNARFEREVVVGSFCCARMRIAVFVLHKIRKASPLLGPNVIYCLCIDVRATKSGILRGWK